MTTKPKAPSVGDIKDAKVEEAPASEEQSTASKTDMRLLFVYGTLKRGHRLASWLSGQSFVGLAEVSDATLIDLGPYPAMIAPVPDHKVRGEVYLVDNSRYAALTNMEVAAGYTEVVVSAKILSGTSLEGIEGNSIGAYAYAYPVLALNAQWTNMADKPTEYIGVVTSVD